MTLRELAARWRDEPFGRDRAATRSDVLEACDAIRAELDALKAPERTCECGNPITRPGALYCSGTCAQSGPSGMIKRDDFTGTAPVIADGGRDEHRTSDRAPAPGRTGGPAGMEREEHVAGAAGARRAQQDDPSVRVHANGAGRPGSVAVFTDGPARERLVLRDSVGPEGPRRRDTSGAPESARDIWTLAEAASAEVATWPAWKRRAADTALVSKPESARESEPPRIDGELETRVRASLRDPSTRTKHRFVVTTPPAITEAVRAEVVELLKAGHDNIFRGDMQGAIRRALALLERSA